MLARMPKEACIDLRLRVRTLGLLLGNEKVRGSSIWIGADAHVKMNSRLTTLRWKRRLNPLRPGPRLASQSQLHWSRPVARSGDGEDLSSVPC